MHCNICGAEESIDNNQFALQLFYTKQVEPNHFLSSMFSVWSLSLYLEYKPFLPNLPFWSPGKH